MAERIKAKDIIITIAVIIVFAVALVLVLNIYKNFQSVNVADVDKLRD